MSKAAVLLSGGIDSTTCLYHAVREHGAENVIALSVFYGQRHEKEIHHARKSVDRLGVRSQLLELDSIIPSTMLTKRDSDIPAVSYDDLSGTSPTYVPFRNGLMLSAVASWFHGALLNGRFGELSSVKDAGEHAIYFGAHAEDAARWAYPDCTPEFIGAMANAIYVGTYGEVRLHTPLQWLNKQQIVKFGESLGVDWSLTWSCYKGGEIHCGECPTCRSRRAGFEAAGVIDLTSYAVDV